MRYIRWAVMSCMVISGFQSLKAADQKGALILAQYETSADRSFRDASLSSDETEKGKFAVATTYGTGYGNSNGAGAVTLTYQPKKIVYGTMIGNYNGSASFRGKSVDLEGVSAEIITGYRSNSEKKARLGWHGYVGGGYHFLKTNYDSGMTSIDLHPRCTIGGDWYVSRHASWPLAVVLDATAIGPAIVASGTQGSGSRTSLDSSLQLGLATSF